MTKILTTSQIRELDAFTIKNEPVASIDLMERACQAFVEWFIDRYHSNVSILIVCGTGNNGGDGLGIASLLHQRGYNVKVSIVKVSAAESADFKTKLNRLPPNLDTQVLVSTDSIEFPVADIVIDAIFGSGLSRPLSEFASKIVSKINNLNAIRIAVDIPSGLFADAQSSGVCIQAQHTVTFQLPKLAFLLPQTFVSVGEWHVVDIGLNKKFIEDSITKNFLIDEVDVKKLIRPRQKFNHKGSFGHSLIMAGSYGKLGANILATKAALRVGSGLVTTLAPKCGYNILQVATPEAMVITDEDDEVLSELPNVSTFNAIAVGPGIGTDEKTISFLRKFLTNCPNPCVIDADGLNILSENIELQDLIPANSILTPHLGEFKRLAGMWQNDFDRLDVQRSLAHRLGCIIVLKGAHTSIALPNGDVYFNSTGNAAMATGGSGDVLTGIITGLLAQQYSPVDASILGVYLHGLAGDLAAQDRSTIIASDIIEQIPNALSMISASI